MSSDTPRTDANIEMTRYERGVEEELERVYETSRQLERELAAALGEVKRLSAPRPYDPTPADVRAENSRLKDWQNRGEYAERFAAELKVERDQLRAELARARQTIEDIAPGARE